MPYASRCAKPPHAGEFVRPFVMRSAGLPRTNPTAKKCASSENRWQNSRLPSQTDTVVRGEVFRLPRPRDARGHEQQGARYAVIVQADEFLGLSTVLVAPTSTSARAVSFRPAIILDGSETRVLVEQTTVVDPQRLGRSAGHLDAMELRSVDEALTLVLGL